MFCYPAVAEYHAVSAMLCKIYYRALIEDSSAEFTGMIRKIDKINTQ